MLIVKIDVPLKVTKGKAWVCLEKLKLDRSSLLHLQDEFIRSRKAYNMQERHVDLLRSVRLWKSVGLLRHTSIVSCLELAHGFASGLSLLLLDCFCHDTLHDLRRLGFSHLILKNDASRLKGFATWQIATRVKDRLCGIFC